jgi:hypothetical protein
VGLIHSAEDLKSKNYFPEKKKKIHFKTTTEILTEIPACQSVLQIYQIPQLHESIPSNKYLFICTLEI